MRVLGVSPLVAFLVAPELSAGEKPFRGLDPDNVRRLKGRAWDVPLATSTMGGHNTSFILAGPKGKIPKVKKGSRPPSPGRVKTKGLRPVTAVDDDAVSSGGNSSSVKISKLVKIGASNCHSA